MAQFALADELGDFLGRTLKPEQVPRADVLLQLASAAIQAEARQQLELVENEQAELRGNWSHKLWLPERPVTAVSGITIRHGSIFVNDWVLQENNDYRWDRLGLVRRVSYITGRLLAPVSGYWGGDMAVVDVTYSHGFEVIPDDLRGVCLQAAARAFSNPIGVEAEAVTNAYSVQYGAHASGGPVALTESELKIVRRYRPVSSSWA